MANLGGTFYPKLVQMTSELGMKPEDLLAVMVSESGINPAAHNPGGATGLIQFMPDTLKGVGYHGTPDQFKSVSGEDQLPYIQRYIADKAKLNGGPFKSAAQYYVANFWPAALKLPGVRREDAATPIVEEHPQTVAGFYSKKYWDLGMKVSASQESAAYKANPLFHGSTPGAITYGDMMNQIEKNKRNPAYRKALLSMQGSTGYTPQNSKPNQMVATKSKVVPIANTLERYLQMVAASEKTNKKLYKALLPNNNVVVKVNAGDYTNSIEFARILCSALEIELMAKAFTHSDGSNIEIECEIAGPKSECVDAVEQLSTAVADAFKTATNKIGGIEVITNCITDKKSSYQPISLKTADMNYRRFLLKFI